ncbi:ABC transporter ATP-binding protein [Erwinia sp. S38]|uniref:ABC transporter ATP-binding protein n=1 Tax=Erwinia sp. S38 TaxID=2769338 RepID=UPI00190CD26F|nr:ABC transporter ATP-binding protein [Erwinia sp. S38]MBK0003733.1 ABC transporter ATP-binding protein [Erwinia sp. S38]
MQLLGEPGRLASRVPDVARMLRLSLVYGAAAGGLHVFAVALLVWMAAPLIVAQPAPMLTLLGLTGSGFTLLLAFFLRQRAEELAHEGSYRLEVALRQQLVEKLSRVPLGVVQSWGSGRLRKILLDDVKALHIAIADAAPFIGGSLSQPLAALLLLTLVQWKLALAAILMLPISLICMTLMARATPQQREAYNQAAEEVNAGVIELVQGMAVMRTFDNGAAGWQRFTLRLQVFTVAVAAWMGRSETPWKLNRLVSAALPTAAVILLVGSVLIANGQITLAQWLLALTLGTLPVKALEPLVHLANYLNDAAAATRRITDILAQPELEEAAMPQSPKGHQLCLESVSFRYPGQTNWALRDITLTLEPGMRCAIVGASGSGKSTLARLIPRFYDVEAGSIRLGGCDIRQIRGESLLQRMALVLQEPFLISGSLEDNLRLASPGASDAALKAVMAATGVDDIAAGLPQGLQTPVAERGSSFSGGQRQRITLARALLADAPLLLLDEATSYLDAHSDRLIQQALGRLAADRTLIVIAHRLHSVVDADLIVMMHEGRLVEQGTHQQLLKRDGYYARLWEHHLKASSWTLQRENTA